MNRTNLLGKPIEIQGDIDKVDVTRLESLIVNLFTPPDVLFDYIINRRKESLGERIRRMYSGKIKDYKRFILISEENNGHLPNKVKNLLKYSPCGLAKMVALYSRNF